jgi:large subunit ribosomal protein L32
MGAVPKSRISKGRRNRRRAHHALKLKTLIVCPNCRQKKLPHRVCVACGTYRGVQVLSV